MISSLRLIGSIVLTLLGLQTAHSTISDCSDGTSVFKLTELGLKPDPPIPNELVDMTVKFTNPGPEIVDGTVTTSVTLNWIPFQPSTEALCTNTQCPLVTGANDRSTSSTWPDIGGTITSKIEWTDVGGVQLLCIQIDATVQTNQTVKKSKANSKAKLRGTCLYTQEDAYTLATMWVPNEPVHTHSTALTVWSSWEDQLGLWSNTSKEAKPFLNESTA
jgi:hypothetical protein